MPVTAKARGQVALRATTSLSPEEALEIVKQASGFAKGTGKSLLTSGVANVGAAVHVEKQTGNRLEMSITSGKRIIELCTFTVEASTSDETTNLRVGPLVRYKTSQSRVMGFIPAGPKSILGYDLYKRFLSAVEQQLKAADATASVTTADPAGVPA